MHEQKGKKTHLVVEFLSIHPTPKKVKVKKSQIQQRSRYLNASHQSQHFSHRCLHKCFLNKQQHLGNQNAVRNQKNVCQLRFKSIDSAKSQKYKHCKTPHSNILILTQGFLSCHLISYKLAKARWKVSKCKETCQFP